MIFLGLAVALVLDANLQPGVEVGHVAQIARDGLVLEFYLWENFGVGRESGLGAGELVSPRSSTLPSDAALVALLVELAVALDCDLESLA